MSSHFVPFVIALKAITLVLGGLITLFAARAYRRTDAAALRALAIGFGLVTVGALTAGVIDLFLVLSRNQALVVESIFTAAGFGVILYSLYVE